MEDHQKPSDEERKAYSQADREKMAKSGQALPDGSFPIANEADLKNAIQAYGRSSDQAAAKAHIIKRAKALGLTSLLPDGWEQNAADEPREFAVEHLREGDWPETEGRSVDRGLEYRQRRAQMLRGAIEHREFDVHDMECRALDDGTLRMSGLASATEHFYDVGDPARGGFRERIRRNVFRSALAEKPDVSLLGNHAGWPLARTSNESLTLNETPAGLQWTADLDPEDPDSRMISRKVDKGLLTECSFAFLCRSDQWNEDYTERTITGLSLNRGDVSIVTHGANEATSVEVSARGLDDVLMEVRAGKTLSSKTRGELEAAKGLIDNLLAEPAEPETEPEVTPTEVALEAVSEQTEEVAREAEESPEKTVLVPDGKRERERLAALRRAA